MCSPGSDKYIRVVEIFIWLEVKIEKFYPFSRSEVGSIFLSPIVNQFKPVWGHREILLIRSRLICYWLITF